MIVLLNDCAFHFYFILDILQAFNYFSMLNITEQQPSDFLSLHCIKSFHESSTNPSSTGRNAEIASVGRHDQSSNPGPSTLCVCEFPMDCHFVYFQKKKSFHESR
jgi:hypothetical protein